MNKEWSGYSMAKMNGEQRAELLMMLDIIDQSEPESKIRYKGKVYYTFTLKNTKGTDRCEMRLIVGINGWTFCPANKNITKCLWF